MQSWRVYIRFLLSGCISWQSCCFLRIKSRWIYMIDLIQTLFFIFWRNDKCLLLYTRLWSCLEIRRRLYNSKISLVMLVIYFIIILLWFFASEHLNLRPSIVLKSLKPILIINKPFLFFYRGIRIVYHFCQLILAVHFWFYFFVLVSKLLLAAQFTVAVYMILIDTGNEYLVFSYEFLWFSLFVINGI